MAARAAVDVNRRTHIVAAQPLVVQLVGPRVHSSETAIISAEESTRARLLVAQLLGDAPGSPPHPLAEQTSTQHINTQSSGVPGTEPQWSSRYGTPSDEGTPPGTQPPPRTSLLGLSIEDQQTPSTLDAKEESFVAGASARGWRVVEKCAGAGAIGNWIYHAPDGHTFTNRPAALVHDTGQVN